MGMLNDGRDLRSAAEAVQVKARSLGIDVADFEARLLADAACSF